MPITIFSNNSTSLIPSLTSQFTAYLLAVVGGSTWICIPGGIPVLAGNQPAAGTILINSTHLVGTASIFGNVYIVDGTSTIFQVAMSTLSMVTYAATTGTAPTFCNLATNWRSRLVLAGDANNPQLYYMARLGVPTDWDYSKTDPAAAVVGNLSESGQIGEPIIALIPYTDDYMIIGCAHSLWMLEGDPADGGAIVRISDQIGIVGPNAWAIDANGTLYFVGSGGLYHVRPIFEKYQPPQNISAPLFNEFFKQLGWATQDVTLVYDTELLYLYIFATSTGSTVSGTHLVYDTRHGGLWPQQFPLGVGPTAAIAFSGANSPNSRSILLGGWDGFIRLMDQGAFDDDNSTISCYVDFGPYQPVPEQAILSATTLDLGEVFTGDSSTLWNMSTVLRGGPNAYSVTEGTARNSAKISTNLDQRQQTYRQRLRGGFFAVRLANSTDNTYFSFEKATLEFLEAGRNRERR